MKHSKSFLSTALLACISLQTWLQANPLFSWEDGHGDLEVSYIQGEWIWTLEQGKEPGSVAIKLGASSLNFVPDLADFEFQGAPDSPIWIIPQSAQAGVPFMGIASETPSGTFVDNLIQLELIQATGPGEVYAWSVGEAEVEIDMNTSDGLDASDRISVPAPGHIHRNFGFSAPGTYRLAFTAKGARADNHQTIQSEPVEVLVKVSVIEDGEVDLELLYETERWELELLDEGTEAEMSSSLAVFELNKTSRRPMPSGLGTYAPQDRPTHLYVLPANQDPDLPFLGIAADELETGVFRNETVSLNLTDKQGPGDIFLYTVGPFGTVTAFFDTSNGLDAQDVLQLQTGEHVHYNIGFTEPGRYSLYVKPSAELLTNNTSTSNESFELLFDVIPPDTSLEHPPFKITITRTEENTYLIRWQSEPGQTYQLQSRSSLDSNGWVDEGSPVNGNGNIMEQSINPQSETMRFFRLNAR